MPQHSTSIVSTCRPGISRSTLFDRRPRRRRPSGGSGRAAAPSPRPGLSGSVEPAGRASRARNSSNSSACAAERLARVARAHGQQLVAQGQQAARLQADDRHAARDKGRERVEHALALRACASSTMPADRKVRPQHSGRASPSAGCGTMHAIAAGLQHAQARRRGSRARNSG